METRLLNIKPIKRKTIPEIVSEKVLELILSGKYQVGDKLPSQKELSELFNVSRPCIREAIYGLSMLGYVELRAGQGCYIRSLNNIPQLDVKFFRSNEEFTLINIFEVRIMLEPMITKLATLRSTKRDREELKKILSQQLKLESQDAGYLSFGTDFHKKIVEFTRNVFLIELMKKIYDELESKINLLYSDNLSLDLNIKQHTEIMNGILSGNSDLAEILAKNHLYHATKELDIYDKLSLFFK